jgi:glycosyltransferase involved in cell wall biosynthesis
MTASIVTPSFRQPEWLQLCMASVADQEGVEVEHIIQDSCSGEDVVRVAAQFPGSRLEVEKDTGMYDAVNRGLSKSSGDFCAYINCDEQYFPGSLAAVADYFTKNPDIDVLFADVVVAGPEAEYICSRQVLLPYVRHIVTAHLPTYTAATFFRRSVFEEGLIFDTDWKELGDAVWVMSLINRGKKMGVLRRYTTLFTDTGENMSFRPSALREKRLLFSTAPAWVRLLKPIWVAEHRLRRLASGFYNPAPFDYRTYTRDNPDTRSTFHVKRPQPIYKARVLEELGIHKTSPVDNERPHYGD